MCSTHRRLRRTRGSGGQIANAHTLSPSFNRAYYRLSNSATREETTKARLMRSLGDKIPSPQAHRPRYGHGNLQWGLVHAARRMPALLRVPQRARQHADHRYNTGCRRAHADELFQQGGRKPRNHASAVDHRVAITAPRFAYCWKNFSSVAAGEAAPILRLPLAASMTSTNSLYLSACLSSRLIMYMLQRPKVRNFAGSL